SAAPPRGESSGARGRSKLRRPENVQQFGPMVSFNQGQMSMIMDRDAFDYIYREADGPDPAQRDLDTLLPQVTHVCVLEGAILQGRAMGARSYLIRAMPRLFSSWPTAFGLSKIPARSVIAIASAGQRWSSTPAPNASRQSACSMEARSAGSSG